MTTGKPRSGSGGEDFQVPFDPRPLEMAVIGFALSWPHRIYDLGALREDHFALPSTRKAFRALRSLEIRSHRDLTEPALIAAEMATLGVPQDESLAIMVEASERAPVTPEAIFGIIEQLLTASMRRSLADAGAEITKLAPTIAKADEGAAKATEVLTSAIGRNVTTKVQTIAEAIEEEMKRLESGADTAQMGLGTGFCDLDGQISGFHEGELIILASRPGMGKSSLAGHMAVAMAQKQSVPGVIFSMEMPAREWVQRALSSGARVDIADVRRNTMAPQQKATYIELANKMRLSRLFINDSGGLSMARISAATRRLYHEEGVRWVIIDYLQLLDHAQRHNESTNDAITRTSTGLKALARGLNIPIIALSQLNRDCEKRDNKRPRLSDLRSSGSIEQDADVVIFVYREEYYHQDDEKWTENNAEMAGVAELLVAKQRSGPVGLVKVAWIKHCAGFANLAPRSASPHGVSMPAWRRPSQPAAAAEIPD